MDAACKLSGSRCTGGTLTGRAAAPAPGEHWQRSSRWPPSGPAGPGTHRTSHPSKPHSAAQAATFYRVTRGFSKYKPHPPTKKQCLGKTDVMKDVKLQNGHLRNHKANSKHSLTHSRQRTWTLYMRETSRHLERGKYCQNEKLMCE